MKTKPIYKKDNEFEIENYIIRCSEHELKIIRTCLISAFQTFEDLEYTNEELNILVNGMTLREIDELIDSLYLPF